MGGDRRIPPSASGSCTRRSLTIDSLLELVRRRKAELESFEAELHERRQRQAHKLRELVA